MKPCDVKTMQIVIYTTFAGRQSEKQRRKAVDSYLALGLLSTSVECRQATRGMLYLGSTTLLCLVYFVSTRKISIRPGHSQASHGPHAIVPRTCSPWNRSRGPLLFDGWTFHFALRSSADRLNAGLSLLCYYANTMSGTIVCPGIARPGKIAVGTAWFLLRLAARRAYSKLELESWSAFSSNNELLCN